MPVTVYGKYDKQVTKRSKGIKDKETTESKLQVRTERCILSKTHLIVVSYTQSYITMALIQAIICDKKRTSFFSCK